MKSLALAGIGTYRRYVSPRKGFACAYRVHRGAASCSRLGERAIRRFGVVAGLQVLRERLARCGEVHRDAHRRPAHRVGAALRSQRGSCDLPCDIPCDGSELVDVCDCADCGDDNKKKKSKDQRKRA